MLRVLLLVAAVLAWAMPASAETPPEQVRLAGVVLKWLRTDKQANYDRAAALIEQAAKGGAKIVCTTECFLDGYAIKDKAIPLEQYRALGEPIPDGAYFQKLAAAGRSARYLAGRGHAGGRRRAALQHGRPDRRRAASSPGDYRKHKLEHELVRNTPGDQTPAFDTPYGRLGLMICADRRDPELVQRLCKPGLDLLICPSGGMFGPKSNDHILQARSKENAVPILFVHPAEFLFTDAQGEVRSQKLLGDRLEIDAADIGGDADSKEVFYFDLPLKRMK